MWTRRASAGQALLRELQAGHHILWGSRRSEMRTSKGCCSKRSVPQQLREQRAGTLRNGPACHSISRLASSKPKTCKPTGQRVVHRDGVLDSTMLVQHQAASDTNHANDT